ncbi:hypothetical protein [Hyphomonas sp.]|uniref:hypothetical protein n=1 Tax=Hyphomonas sp. TaxID=87 RepID=UPI003918AC55
MDRQTLDMEGARQGEISAASLQLGDDTIAVKQVATMSVERHEFAPWDTPRNRKVQSVYATLSVSALFFGLVGLGWWALRPQQADGVIGLAVGGGLLLLGVILGVRAVMIATMLKRREPYFRLQIGTSDGRQIPLVDNSREVLVKIRDIIRHKLDTGDAQIVGDFDLNLDIVNLRTPKGLHAVSPPPPQAQEDEVFEGRPRLSY